MKEGELWVTQRVEGAPGIPVWCLTLHLNKCHWESCTLSVGEMNLGHSPISLPPPRPWLGCDVWRRFHLNFPRINHSTSTSYILIIKCHRLGGLNNRHLFPHSGGGLEFQDQGSWQIPVLVRACFLACRWLLIMCPHMIKSKWTPWCLCLELYPSQRPFPPELLSPQSLIARCN